MILKDRIVAFVELGNLFLKIKKNTSYKNYLKRAELNNSWFTKSSIIHAFEALGNILQYDKLNNWISNYYIDDQARKIGVVVPSNIPLVGFYDFLCVLISGNIFLGKLSKSNNVLLPFVAKLLCDINPEFHKKIFFPDSLSKLDFLIATGSDNTSHYFEYLFRDTKKIIRKNRNSVAVLDGCETPDDLIRLSDDIFMYFGLGCRNVSKIFIPKSFDLSELNFFFRKYLKNKLNINYSNNYDYQKTMCDMNSLNYLDFDNLLLIQSEKLDAPIGVLYYEKYNNISNVKNFIDQHELQIQCVVSNITVLDDVIRFGTTQRPSLFDFPDGVDIMKFLTNI